MALCRMMKKNLAALLLVEFPYESIEKISANL